MKANTSMRRGKDARQSDRWEHEIVPVLLGGDLNCYSVARAFHEAYGVRSHVFGHYKLAVTAQSALTVRHPLPTGEEEAIAVLRAFAEEQRSERGAHALFLIGCTDEYAELLIRRQTELSDRYLLPCPPADVAQRLWNKADFYALCRRYRIPVPQTFAFDLRGGRPPAVADFETRNTGISYPAVLKPARSSLYWKHRFDGMKKAYVVADAAQAADVAAQIAAAGYPERLLLQEYIPGGDDHMYVLTAYFDRDGHLRCSCFGHVLLEEHTPCGIGNHAAILTEPEAPICFSLLSMLEEQGYRGFANFDMKYDARRGRFCVFEVNLRQGRSNYYMTRTGLNLAQMLVADYMRDGICYPVKREEIYWHAVPHRIVSRYTGSAAAVREAEALLRAGQATDPYAYAYDLLHHPLRALYLTEQRRRQYRKYGEYCERVR